MSIADQTPRALAATSYGVLSLAPGPDGDRWWLLLSPIEHPTYKPDGTALDLGVREHGPNGAELTDILADHGLMARTEWRQPRPHLDFRNELAGGFGTVVLCAGVATPKRYEALRRRRQAESDEQHRRTAAYIRNERIFRTSLALGGAALMLFALLEQGSSYYHAMRTGLLPICIVLGAMVWYLPGARWVWLAGLAAVAVAWNPFVPFYYGSRDSWAPWNVAGVIFFAALAWWSHGRLTRNALPASPPVVTEV